MANGPKAEVGQEKENGPRPEIPSNRRVVRIIFSQGMLCKRMFMHVQFSSCPELCSVKIDGLYDKRGRPHLDQNLSSLAVLSQAGG